MKYKCAKCGSLKHFLLDGGVCSNCFQSNQITDLPKTEKASFTIDINNKRKLNRNRKAKKVGKLIELTCIHCEKDFETTNKHKIYCSRSCQYRASQDRYRERKQK